MSWQHLKEKLRQIDRKGYKAYKIVAGRYEFDQFTLFIDHVQGDPFATPSRIRLRVDQTLAKFPSQHYQAKIRRIALEDYITRGISQAISKFAKKSRGTGKSGLILVQQCGQEVLERTSVRINKEYIEARLEIGLPAKGRTILAGEAQEMLFQEIPAIVKESLFCESYSQERLKKHVDSVEDQDNLRHQLKALGLVSFIADNSLLPRESGISDKPMAKGQAVPFLSPPSKRVIVELPRQGSIQGMGLPQGITLVVGGGYHGKTTLLKAIEKGVYNHIPGDGRELVATLEDAVKIRAEDGRRVEKVDISPFITNLPKKKDTGAFSTEDASGSTSQAANIIEAVELDTSLLLIDEDTSATNFMIRDERMQNLVAKDKEPITPFIDKAKLLYQDLGVSTIIVLGGSGDYFDIADNIIMMDEYHPKDVTTTAKEIAKTHKTRRKYEGGKRFGNLTPRIPQPKGFNPHRGKKIKVKGRGLSIIEFGRQSIDLSFLGQLVDPYQTQAIARSLLFALEEGYFHSQITLKKVAEKILAEIEKEGLGVLSSYQGHPGKLAVPRKHELGAAINRLRTLQINQVREL